jgi:fibro-slime domain-containing protein
VRSTPQRTPLVASLVFVALVGYACGGPKDAPRIPLTGGDAGSGGATNEPDVEGGAGLGDAGVPTSAGVPASADGGAETAPGVADGTCKSAEGATLVFAVTIRDFSQTHPDFEKAIAAERGLVASRLGPDRKPVFAGQPSVTISGAESFDQWYRDVPGVNVTIPLQLAFTADGAGLEAINKSAYFPIDDLGFGNEGREHNFHFTTEIHTELVYRGGETFAFSGDDDVWGFVNETLVIDLGGVHGEEMQTIRLDDLAASVGLAKGQPARLDLFHAERHTQDSHFRIETNVDFTKCSL